MCIAPTPINQHTLIYVSGNVTRGKISSNTRYWPGWLKHLLFKKEVAQKPEESAKSGKENKDKQKDKNKGKGKDKGGKEVDKSML